MPEDRGLGECDCEPALRAVLCTPDQSRPDQLEDRLLEAPLRLEIDRRHSAPRQIVYYPQVLRAPEFIGIRPKEYDHVILLDEARSDDEVYILDHPDHPDSWGRVDCTARPLIEEGDITTHHRCLEDLTRLRDPEDRLPHLVVDRRVEWATEVQIVRHRPRPRALTDQVPRRLRYRDHRSEEHTSELQSRGHLVCRL